MKGLGVGMRKSKKAKGPLPAAGAGKSRVSSGLKSEERTIAKGTFWGLSGSVAFKLVSFVYTVILARLFAPGDVGVFYLALSIVYVLSIFSDLGMNGAFGRYVPFFMGRGEKEKTYVLLRASYVFSGAVSFLFGVILFLASGLVAEMFGSGSLGEVLRIMSIFSVLNTFFSLNTSFLGGLKMVKENALIGNAQNALKLVLTVALYYAAGPNAFVIALAFVLSYLLLVLLSFWFVRRSLLEQGVGGLKPSISEQFSMIKETMAFGITLSIIATIWGIFNYTDRIMMGYLMPRGSVEASIGIYSIAVSLGTVILLFPGAIMSIFMPVISELYGKGKKDDMLSVSKTALRWSIFLMVPITATLIAFPGELLEMFYGSTYAPGATVVMVFAAGLFIRYLSFVHETILAAMRVVRISLYVGVMAAVLNIVLNYFLIPPYGMDGAIAATSISLLFVTLLLIYFCKKISGFGFPKEAYLPVAGGLFTLIVLLALRGPALGFIGSVPSIPLFGQPILDLVLQKLVKLGILGVLFFLSCTLYFGALVALKALRREDIAIASGLLRRAKVPEETVFAAERAMGLN